MIEAFQAPKCEQRSRLKQPNELMLNPTPRVDSSIEGQRTLTLRSLFEAEEGGLLRYAFSLVGRRAVAEEIVQEVFLQLHMRWEDVESPREWLYRSVRNRAFNHVRNHRRELPGKGQAQLSSASDEEAEPPEAAIARMETAGKLRDLLSELDQDDGQLIQLKYFEGLKYREISERTGLSVSNVGYRLHHLLKDLASKLKSMGIDTKS